MNVTVALLTLLLLAVVIAVISAPLLGVRRERDLQSSASSADLEELRTAREAKYRELRDLELDYRTGKLSEDDYAASSGTLRAEAVELLNRIETLEAEIETLQAEGPTAAAG